MKKLKVIIDFIFPVKFKLKIEGDVYTFKGYYSLHRVIPKWISLDDFFKESTYSHGANVNSLLREVFEFNGWMKLKGSSPQNFFYRNVAKGNVAYYKFLNDQLSDNGISEMQRKRSQYLMEKFLESNPKPDLNIFDKKNDVKRDWTNL